MGKKAYSVLSEWFKRTDSLGYKISSWCKKVDDTSVECIICNCILHCITKGFAAVTQHVSTTTHEENVAVKLHSSQFTLEKINSGTISNTNVQNTPQLTMVCSKETVTKAEIIWALKSIQCNMAASVSDDLKDVFSVMFSCNTAENFQLGRTKLTYYITEALGPYFNKELINDIKNSYFTLLYDETTNNAGKKELQFQIRYWSENLKEVVCRHLNTIYIGHATSADIVREIENTLNSNNLCVSKLLMLGSDGPNVNKKVWNLINEKVLDVRSEGGLINIGTCNLHIIHNAFLKGLEEFGDTASELITDIYYYFKKFPSRWEDFQTIQHKNKLKNNHFIKHSANRWLSIGPACERILEQWPAILEYFSVYLPANHKKTVATEKYKRIMKTLKYVDILVELTFVAESSQMYSKFNEFFQFSIPLIHALATELTNLLIKVSGRICKPDAEIQDKILLEHLRKASEIDCDIKTKKEIKKLKQSEQNSVFYKIQRHYMASYNHIISKNILKKNILKDLQCLGQKNILEEKSVKRIGRIANFLSFLGIQEVNIKDEWRILQSEIISSNSSSTESSINYNNSKRIDHFWRDIIYQETSLSKLKYPSLNKLIKSCLSLSHGNSDVERGFSISRRILSEDKALMSEKVLNYRLLIRDALKQYSTVAHFQITKELLKLAYGARKSYEHFLEEQKMKKEEEKRIQEENEEKLRKEKLEKEKLLNLNESVTKLEKKASLVNQEKKEIQESADKLSAEANERLKLALETKDMEGIRIAQAMIEGSLKLREKQKEHEDNEQKLNKIVSKRKQCLIDSFMSKKPKK